MAYQDGDFAALTRRARVSGFWGGILASVIGGLVLTLLTTLFPWLWSYISTPVVPNGAILAFDRVDLNDQTPCPKGWIPYQDLQGRMIVGATAAKPYRSNGGSETVKLTEQQLPPHSFKIRFVPDRENLQNGGYDLIRQIVDFGNADAKGTASTSVVGNGDAITIAPPYRALYFCIRD